MSNYRATADIPIKAIETAYSGHRFRSRLEARWACFMDCLGIEWEYEKEGFDLDGLWYLPDFWLPKQNCWMEVKGSREFDFQDKAERLFQATKKPVYVFAGKCEPGYIDRDVHGFLIGFLNGASRFNGQWGPPEFQINSPDWRYLWAYCEECRAASINPRGGHEWLLCECPAKYNLTDNGRSPSIVAAFMVVRSIRFDDREYVSKLSPKILQKACQSVGVEALWKVLHSDYFENVCKSEVASCLDDYIAMGEEGRL